MKVKRIAAGLYDTDNGWSIAKQEEGTGWVTYVTRTWFMCDWYPTKRAAVEACAAGSAEPWRD